MITRTENHASDIVYETFSNANKILLRSFIFSSDEMGYSNKKAEKHIAQ